MAQALAVLHIVEQLIFGMQDLESLRHMIVVYDGLFSDTRMAIGSLVTIGAALVSLGIFCILRGGRARFLTLITLGLPTIGEVHHLFATVHARHYTPGTVTGVPSLICGLLFLRALVKEYGLRQAVDGPSILEPLVVL